jgi:uncharacterized damage-inducible protein DinB
MDTNAQIVDTWNINNRIHLYMLDAIPSEALSGISASKGRSVGEQFAHIHNVRLMWLQSADKALHETQSKIEKPDMLNKDLLRERLIQSGEAIATLLIQGLESARIKGFKPHPVAFVGYLLSHEGYHRGEIGIILTQSGHPLDQKTSYGLWEWGSR